MRTPGPISVRRSVDRAPWRRLAAAAPLFVGLLAVAPTASAAPPRAVASAPGGDPHVTKRRAAPASKPRRIDVPRCAVADAAVDAETAPEDLYGRGHCEELEGHLVAALEIYETALRRHPGPTLARQLQARIGAIVPRLGTLRIDATAWPVGIRVRAGTRVLGGERPWVDPGRVEITVDAPGFEESTQLVDVATGEEKAVSLSAPRRLAAGSSPAAGSSQPSDVTPIGPPAPLSSAAPDRRAAAVPEQESVLRPLGYVGLAVGGAALVAGGVTGYLAIDRGRVVRSECPTPTTCSPSGAAAARAGASFSTASTVALASGVVVTLGALALVFLGAPKPRTVTVAGYVLLGGG